MSAARRFCSFLLLVSVLAFPPSSWATEGESSFAARILVDAETGQVLFEDNAHVPRPPASMVKMMLILLTMEAVADGTVSLDDPVKTSAWASRMGGSQVYLKEGEVFPLRDMLKAVVIASANDAAVAIAEHQAGTADAFVDLMNQRAQRLGLTDTTYRTVHGLPPRGDEEGDVTSAYDLAQLGRKLLGYDVITKLASTPTETFRDGKFHLTNTNKLVSWYRGANGMKTGYHAKAGFGVTATATRDDLSLVAVVLGSRRRNACFDEAARLLTQGFSSYRVVAAARAGEPIGAQVPVEGGEVNAISAVAAEDLRMLVNRMDAPKPEVEARLPRLLNAPVKKGQRIGEVAIVSSGKTLGAVDLVAERDVVAVGWLGWWRNWQAESEPEPENEAETEP